MEEKLVKKLVTSLKCTTCGRCYEEEDVNILGHYEDLWFLGAFCPTCRARYLVAAVIKEAKKTEPVSDLTALEVSKFEKVDEPTADDVLDMHNFLRNFDGDFSRCFGRR